MKSTIWIALCTIAAAVLIQVLAGGEWGIFVGLGGMVAEVIVLLIATRAANRAARACQGK